MRDLPERGEHENADLNDAEPQHARVGALARVAESSLARLEVTLLARHVLGSVVQLAHLQLDGCVVKTTIRTSQQRAHLATYRTTSRADQSRRSPCLAHHCRLQGGISVIIRLREYNKRVE